MAMSLETGMVEIAVASVTMIVVVTMTLIVVVSRTRASEGILDNLKRAITMVLRVLDMVMLTTGQTSGSINRILGSKLIDVLETQEDVTQVMAVVEAGSRLSALLGSTPTPCS